MEEGPRLRCAWKRVSRGVQRRPGRRLYRDGRVVRLYGRRTCCQTSIPGGRGPSIGWEILSPGWSGLLSLKVFNIRVESSDDILSNPEGRAGGSIHARGAVRGRGVAARVGGTLMTHMELSGGRRPG